MLIYFLILSIAYFTFQAISLQFSSLIKISGMQSKQGMLFIFLHFIYILGLGYAVYEYVNGLLGTLIWLVDLIVIGINSKILKRKTDIQNFITGPNWRLECIVLILILIVAVFLKMNELL